ncbi:MAG: tetratricopeptide repeat protein [Rhodospirillaceae bacterium]
MVKFPTSSGGGEAMNRRQKAKTAKAGRGGGAGTGALFELAQQHHQAGDLAAAEGLYREILAQDPNHDGALHYLGILACQIGRWEIAEALIGQAVALRPDHAEARNNLGTALWQQGKTAAAAAEFARALTLKPDYAEAHNNFANTLKELGRLSDAVDHYRQALSLRATYPEALNNLGSALQSLGRPAEAIVHYEQALKLRANYPEAHNNFGNALLRLGRVAEAVERYQHALKLRPAYAEARNNLGGALVHLGRLGEAESCFEQALAAKPDFAGALNNLGGALQQQGRMEEAAARFGQALALRPDYEEAERNLIYGLLYRPGIGLAEMLEAARRWSARHAEPLAPATPPALAAAAAGWPPRLGFVSGDFREHVVGRLASPALEALARAGWDFVCYSNHPIEDGLTARFRAAAAAWRPIHGLSDDEAAALIRADGIEILFDLSGYTADGRLTLFARKPAPLQVTWLGYPATTGMTAMDYLLADPVQAPPESDRYYQEKIIRLPGCYLLYRPIAEAPEVGPLPRDGNGFVTFGSFNGVQKLAPPVIECWSRILRRLPDSRLVLKAPGFTEEGVRRRYREMFAGHGIGSERLEFLGRTSPAEHMRAMSAVDIALDSFPYAGGATTVDSLWMGAPVVALNGETFAHRHSAGYLGVTGLGDLVADDVEGYVGRALELAADRPRLAALRAGLRARMLASPLCDEAGFVAAFTAACTAIRARALAGAAPASLDV